MRREGKIGFCPNLFHVAVGRPSFFQARLRRELTSEVPCRLSSLCGIGEAAFDAAPPFCLRISTKRCQMDFCSAESGVAFF